MKVYISFINAQFVVHTDSKCADIKLEARAGERVVIVTNDNLIDILQLFIKHNWKFSSSNNKDDIWLDITLNHPKLEESLVFVVRAILTTYVPSLKDSTVVYHC